MEEGQGEGEAAGPAAAASAAGSQGRKRQPESVVGLAHRLFGRSQVKRQLETVERGGGESRVLSAWCRQVERPADCVGQRRKLARGRRRSGDARLGRQGGPSGPFTAPHLADQRAPEPVESIGTRAGECLEPPGMTSPAECLADSTQQGPLGPVMVVDQSLGTAGFGGHTVHAPDLESITEQDTGGGGDDGVFQVVLSK